MMLSATTVGAGAAAATTTADAATVVKTATGWNVWDRVATCESTNNWSINTGNGFYGGLQFTRSTWNEFGGGAYAARADLASREQQIRIAQNVLKVQGPGAWPVCSVRAGLTVSNGLAVQVGGGSTPPTTTNPPRTTTPPVSRGTTRGLAVDGILGPNTTRAVQKWVGTTQDGSFGPITTRALQRKVGAYVDGWIGRYAVAKIQDKVGAPHTGGSSLDPTTVKYLQRYLNAHVL